MLASTPRQSQGGKEGAGGRQQGEGPAGGRGHEAVGQAAGRRPCGAAPLLPRLQCVLMVVEQLEHEEVLRNLAASTMDRNTGLGQAQGEGEGVGGD